MKLIPIEVYILDDDYINVLFMFDISTKCFCFLIRQGHEGILKNKFDQLQAGWLIWWSSLRCSTWHPHPSGSVCPARTSPQGSTGLTWAHRSNIEHHMVTSYD